MTRKTKNHSRVIELPRCGVTITLGKPDPRRPGAYLGGGIVASDLHDEHYTPSAPYDVAMGVVESFILAAACAGVSVESPAFVEAVETTVDGVINHYG